MEKHPRLVALIVAAAFFMENLDGTVIAIALPAIAESLGTDAVALTIGVTAYLLALGAVIPASGWLADRFGVRNVFCAAIGVFTFASILCGLSGSLLEFTAARVLQGAAAALMSPVGRLAILRTASKRDLVRAIWWITWPGLIAPVVGPPLGGFIATYGSWRWIFFLNVPLGLLGMFLVARYVPNLRESVRRRFDGVGFALTAFALAAIMYGVEAGAQGYGSVAFAAAIFAAGVVAAYAAVRRMRRVEHPILDLSTLRISTFAAVTLWAGTLFRLTSGAMPYLLPLFFQIGFGMNAVRAGFLVLAYAAGNLGMKTVTTPALRIFGFRRLMVFNGLLAAATILACAALRPSTPEIVTVALLFICGCFRSMQLTCLATLTFADVPDSQKSSAATISTMSHQLSMSVGIAIAALVLSFSAGLRGAGADDLALWDFQIAFVVMAALAAASILRFALLEPAAGAEVSGHRMRRIASSEATVATDRRTRDG
jgi:EmrB/QacA subfamily drug resistance transporter